LAVSGGSVSGRSVSGDAHSRDTLANLLWPEYDQRHAHAALRRTLSTLNKALAGEHLQIDREAVALDSAGVWLDVAEFHGHLAQCQAHDHAPSESCSDCEAPLAQAVGLYRDDFLAGFTLRDSPNFDEWQFFQAEGFRRELAGALERLVDCLSEQGQFEPAIAYARRWLAMDNLHEPAHRGLMRLYSWAGQRAAAMRQYRECARILEQELGVAPLEETTRLYEAIKELQTPNSKLQTSRQRPQDSRLKTQAPTAEAQSLTRNHLRATTSPSGRPISNPPLPITSHPLVGRETEWHTLLQHYGAIQSDGRLIVLEGEAGIGKTRLSEAFLEHVRAQGSTAIVARCYEGEANLAYGPFIEGLRSAIQAGLAGARRPRWLETLPVQWLSEAGRLLPELSTLSNNLPPAPPLDGPGAQSRFFEGLSQLLLALCGTPAQPAGPAGQSPPGVLFLDDLHWADGASLDLLNYLVRRLRGRPLYILGTWRGEQVPIDHRLRQTLLEAGRNGLGTLRPLSRLSRSAVTELVQSAAPDISVPAGRGRDASIAGLTERLYRESEGLPFFVVEYLAMVGAVQAAEADWSLPGGVRHLLDSRLAQASETGRQLLSAAAVIGRSFDFETLQEASGRGAEETVAGLETLIGQGLVREVKAEEAAAQLLFDFSHEKLRSLVYEETSLARRRLLHHRIAQALEQRARLRRQLEAMAGQIAEHYRLGGREAEASRLFKLAGEHARALFANAEALSQFRLALALGPASRDEPETAALHEAIGDLQTLAGEYTAALASYETAAAVRQGAALAGLEHKAGRVYDRRGNWELAETQYQAALQALDTQAPNGGQASERARVYADWSLTAHRKGETGQALELAEQALQLAEAAGDQRALAQVHNILGVLASSQRDLEKARRQLERSLELAEHLGDPGARVAALNNLALAYRRSGDLDQALALTEQALRLCASQGDRHREAALHNNLADLLHEGGRGEEAMAHLKQAVTIFAEIGADPTAGRWQPEIWKLTEW
jgi:predicted ATPase